MNPPTAHLLILCPDAPGVVAATSTFLSDHRGNILEADQHTDPNTKSFYMRIEFETDRFNLDRDSYAQAWHPIAERFAMDWRIEWASPPSRIAIMCSKQTHCLSDLLWRIANNEVRANATLVISNHEAARSICQSLSVPFHYMPISPESKLEQEHAVLELLEQEHIELCVLARYMQVLSPAFIERFPHRIINIHHSFLPAFAGARPYHEAFARGVKLIGATSHYVTAQLDQGPIIAQSTTHVTHRETVDDLVRKGRDLERMVLAQAVRLHLCHKILVAGDRTVVFD